MRRVIGCMVISAVALMSGCSNTYDKEIDQVISLETVDIKDAKKDIDQVERDKTCVKVYEDGRLIELNYKIRKSSSARAYYKRIKGEYKSVVDSEAKATVNLEEKPVYQENNCE
ncbi:cystatin-like fold lipoprotein (plasmid) [Bacillus mycoides]|uniref:cystatin-like fold lipoprotein n=1 Tax=Bacillus mycoides TaxID=1405 RepID=UPI001C0362B0|nr:cystatin-like fold lipoprotein [Bacillus mycoides]QWH75356.1 cystatin-like fold lipoprotein [Bacillus mycoides]QWH76100.1 cystatin-like fold lipoprotein [Bacillus mycoides]